MNTSNIIQDALAKSMQENFDYEIELLRTLVEIPSSTKNIVGVNAVQSKVAEQLLDLGFTTLMREGSEEGYGQLLVAELNKNAKETVTLVFHADTVTEGKNGQPEFSWDKGQRIATGPGIADDKAGITVALSGLRQFLSSNTSNINIQVISSPNEELGSPGFWNQLRNLGSKSWMCLGFEPALDNGSVISSRHGNRWYDISIKGREAHSGRASGEEINAAHEFALKMALLLELKKKYPNIKLNIGSLRSDKDVFNIVCGRIKAKLDLRFESNFDRDHASHDIIEILRNPLTFSKDGSTPEVTWEIADDCPSFSNGLQSARYLDAYTKIISQLESRNIFHQHSGGASDLNHVVPEGAVAIDGLGAVGGRIHTNQEYIYVDTLSTRARSLSFFLSQINQTP